MIRLLLLLCLALSLTIFSQASSAADTRSKSSARNVVTKALQSIVLVVVQDADGEILGKGSGFVFDKNKVATNLHVIKGADRGYVKTLSSSITYKIDKVIGSDQVNDLCVFVINEIEASSLPLGNSSRLQVGDDVYVAGNPRGMEGTITKGIISSIRSDRNLLQIDAAISPGSSGGPVINSKGEVIGIVKSTLTSGQNLNFAIPVDALKKMKDKHSMPFKGELSLNMVGEWYLSDREIKHIKGPAKAVKTRTFDTIGLEQNEKYDVIGNNIESEFIMKKSFKHIREFDSYQIVVKTKEYLDGELKSTSTLNPSSPEYGEAVFKRFDRRKINKSSVMSATAAGSDSLRVESFYNARGLEYKTVGRYPIGNHSCINEHDANNIQIASRCTYEHSGSSAVETCKYNYDYDSYGNWLKKYEHCSDKKRVLKEERTISYFD